PAGRGGRARGAGSGRRAIGPAPQGARMIRLYVVRHAPAVESGAGPDAQRTLTGKGRKRFHKTARAFGRRGEKLDAIFTSPLVRAVQTAEILAGEVRHGEVTVLDELGPGHTPDALL